MNFSSKIDLISVIIPVYNVEKTLKRCVDSVLEQSYTNIEIILVDDGSTDRSIEICEQYAENFPNIRVLHQENNGLSETRNNGVKIAKGEYIIFLDSDDWWEADFIYQCMKKNQKSKNKYDLFIGAAQKADAVTGERIYIGKHFEKEKIDGKNGEEVLSYILQEEPRYEWYVWRYLVKKSLVLKLEFERGRYYEDVLWMPQILLKTQKVAYIDEVFLNYYYHNETSILNTPTLKKSLDKIYVSKKMIEYADKHIKNSKLQESLKYNFSVLFLSAYGDYINGSNELKSDLRKNYFILKYNYDQFGKFSFKMIRMFGFTLGSKIVKLASDYKKMRH